MFSDAKTGAVMTPTLHAYSSGFFKLAFSPDGKLLAAAGRPAGAEWEVPAAKVWDIVTHKMVAELAGHTELVLDVAFAPDGKTLVTCAVDDSIKFWDTTTWKEIPPSLGQMEYVSAVALSPNGRTLATACSDGTMKLWSFANRRELASLAAGNVHYVTFSPDGQALAAFDWDGSLHLWRAPVPGLKRK
jgi:WD40 repeat protein